MINKLYKLGAPETNRDDLVAAHGHIGDFTRPPAPIDDETPADQNVPIHASPQRCGAALLPDPTLAFPQASATRFYAYLLSSSLERAPLFLLFLLFLQEINSERS